jgi:hypothetical protein
MRRVCRKANHLPEGSVQALKHLVEGSGQSLNLIARRPLRQPFFEIAGMNSLRGRDDGANGLQRTADEEKPACAGAHQRKG